MSFVEVKNQGHGYVAMRLEIEGWPFEFVSHPQLARVKDDGRQRVACLIAESVDYEHLCDVAFLELDGSAPTIKICEPDDPTLTGIQMLAPYPNEHGVLNDETTDTDTTLDFTATVSTPSIGDVVHVGQEAMEVTGTSPLTVARGVWGSYARYHYQVSENTTNSIYPIVFDSPAGMEGRRAKLFLYGGTDDMDSDYTGFPVWRGIVLGSPMWGGDGTWTIPMGRLDELYNKPLSQGFGQDIVPRGIDRANTFTLTGVIRDYPAATFANISLQLPLGFWETQQDFIDDLDTEFASDLAALTSVTSRGLSAVEGAIIDSSLTHPKRGGVDLGAWCLKITISTKCYLYFETSDPVEPHYVFDASYTDLVPAIFDSSKTFFDYMPYPSSNGYLFDPGTYYIVADPDGYTSIVDVFGDDGAYAGAGLVPRKDKSGLSLYPSKVYSVGVDPSATGEGSLFRAQSPNEDDFSQYLVSSYDHSLAKIVSASALPAYTPFFETTYQLIAAYGWNRESTIGDIVSRDFANFSKQALPGDSPPFFTDDIQDFDTEAFIASWSLRELYLATDTGLLEVIAPDLIAEEKMLYYKSDGSIGIRGLPTLSAQTGSYTVSDADLIEAPTIEPFGKVGVTNVYGFEFDYDWREDKFFNRMIARDVASVSAHGERRSKEFSWLTTERGTAFAGPTRAELEGLAQNYFDIFGSKVYLVECPCNMTHIDDELGDVAELTLSELPNPKTGLFGIDAWGAVLIGRRVTPMEGRVVLQFLTRGNEL